MTTRTIQPPQEFFRPISLKLPPKEKPLSSTHDHVLAVLNAARLCADYGLARFPDASIAIRAVLWIPRILQLGASYSVMPHKNLSKLETALLDPHLAMLGGYFGFSWLPKLHVLVVGGGVLRNSVPKLLTSLREVTKRPGAAIRSALVHIFNIGSQGYFTHQEMGEIDVYAAERRASWTKWLQDWRGWCGF